MTSSLVKAAPPSARFEHPQNGAALRYLERPPGVGSTLGERARLACAQTSGELRLRGRGPFRASGKPGGSQRLSRGPVLAGRCEPPVRHLTVTHGRKGSRIRRRDQRDAVANGGGRRRRTEGQVSRDTFLTHDGVRWRQGAAAAVRDVDLAEAGGMPGRGGGRLFPAYSPLSTHPPRSELESGWWEPAGPLERHIHGTRRPAKTGL